MADEEHDVYGGEIPEDAEGEYDLEKEAREMWMQLPRYAV